MVAQNASFHINNLTPFILNFSMGFKKIPIIPAGDKAHLLAVGLIRHPEIHLFCDPSNLILCHRAEWEYNTPEFTLSEGKEEIGLILNFILCLTEVKPSSLFFYPRIMARSQVFRSEFHRTPEEEIELYKLIA